MILSISPYASSKSVNPCLPSNLACLFLVLGWPCDAMHSIFLHHAVPTELNVSIMNSGGPPDTVKQMKNNNQKPEHVREEVMVNKAAD